MLEHLRRKKLIRKAEYISNKQKRNIYIKKLVEVKTIGVLFNASDETKYNKALSLIRYFQNDQKKVQSIAFCNNKILPKYIETSESINCLITKDLNLFFEPKKDFVNKFIKTEFDLLIDLNFDINPSLDFISRTSLAHCKIGLNQKTNTTLYDFMLEGIDSNDLNLFLKQLIHYLEYIKN